MSLASGDRKVYLAPDGSNVIRFSGIYFTRLTYSSCLKCLKQDGQLMNHFLRAYCLCLFGHSAWADHIINAKLILTVSVLEH